MHVVIETERLILRQFTMDDAPLIYALNQDPEVTRYTLDPLRDLAHARQVLEEVILPQYVLFNHGRWAVHTRPALEFIGWCGLKTRMLDRGDCDKEQEIDLGFRFQRSAWGKGFATEAALACIRYGFEERGLKTITGRALPGNIASIRVLEKCGMLYRGEEIVEGLLHKTYEAQSPFIS